MSAISDMLDAVKILPVLTVGSVEEALAVSEALAQGGIRAIEITLRTAAAAAAIGAVKKALPNLLVGAGTVNSAASMRTVAAAGADFAISPGMTPALIRAAQDEGLPFVPGVATASEVLLGMEMGLDCFKLFPAAAIGGYGLLKAFAEPFAGVRFCPTGGINPDNFIEYLALPNVVCIGGGWLAPRALLERQDWAAVTQLASVAFAQIPTAKMP